MSYSKKSQIWGFDLMIASMIFIVGIIIFYLYSLNSSDQNIGAINTLSHDGNIIAKTLLSEGFPEDWDENNVTDPGILSNNKINQTKLERFYNLSTNNYQKSLNLFNTPFNYYIHLSENFTIAGQQVDGIGNLPSNPKNLVKITRITIYNDKPIDFNIEIWE